MNLGLSQFERRLRKLIITALREDPSRWKEYKLRRGQRTAIPFKFFWVGPLLLLAAYAIDVERIFLPALALAVSGRAFTFAAGTIRALFDDPDLGAIYYLPLADREYLRLKLRRVFFGSLGLVVVGLPAYVSMFWIGSWVAQAAIIPALVMHWLVFAALTLLILRYAMRFGPLPGYAFYATVVALIMWGVEFPVIASALQTGVMVLPTAWVDFAFRSIAAGRWANALAFLLPAIALVVSIPKNYAFFTNRFLKAVEKPEFPLFAEDQETEMDCIT